MYRIHTTTLTGGIKPNPEFAKKGLANFAVNVGTKCGHDCTYCSTGSMLYRHRSFKLLGENPFDFGYAIVDPSVPERVALDAKTIRKRGLVQICATVDAWAPEAQLHNLGRRCLEAILSQPDWTVRVLTKNAAVRNDFDLIESHHSRVLVGLSITATPEKSHIARVIEPNASPIEDRIATLREAHRRGIRTYLMLCPLLPGLASSREDVQRLIDLAFAVGAEEIFVEPVNARGPGLRLTEDALRGAGHISEADAVHAIRNKSIWSNYAVELLRTVQAELRKRNAIDRLRFLLYASGLQTSDRKRIKCDDEGVRWLEKPTKPKKSTTRKLRGAHALIPDGTTEQHR